MTKNSPSTFLIATIAALAISVQAAYHHKIEPFSFDLKKFEYPLEYHKWGTAVALRRTIKLVPKVENRYGGLWLSQVSVLLPQIHFLTGLYFAISLSKPTCLNLHSVSSLAIR